MLAAYIGINLDFIAIIVSLHRAGISVTSVDHAITEEGQDLLHMIRRFLETVRGLQDARLWNQGWVAALGQVESALS